jgi:hypothetical protein
VSVAVVKVHSNSVGVSEPNVRDDRHRAQRPTLLAQPFYERCKHVEARRLLSLSWVASDHPRLPRRLERDVVRTSYERDRRRLGPRGAAVPRLVDRYPRSMFGGSAATRWAKIRVIVLLAGAVLATVSAACGGDDDASAGSESRLTALLEYAPMPEAGVGGVLSVGDVQGVRDERELGPPPDRADEDAFAEYFSELLGGADTDGFFATPGADLIPFSAVPQEEIYDELGLRLVDVDRFIQTIQLLGVSDGPEQSIGPFTILEGDRIDPQDLTAAIGEPEQEAGAMVWTLGTGDGQEQNLADSTPVRPLGQALRIAYDSERLLVTPSEADLDLLLQATSGEAPTAAGDEDLVAIATALDDRDVLGADLARGLVPPRGQPGDTNVVPVPTYLAWGLGTAPADEPGEAISVLVLAYPDDQGAAEGATALETVLADGRSSSGVPWSEVLNSSDVSTDGRLVIALIDYTAINPWQRLMETMELIGAE